MTYAGGNKNKIIRSKKLLNPDPRTTEGWKGWCGNVSGEKCANNKVDDILTINDRKNKGTRS